MNKFVKKLTFFLIVTFAFAGFSLFINGAQAGDKSGPSVLIKEKLSKKAYQAENASEYWTQERRQNAIPMQVQTVVMPEGAESKAAIMAEKSLQEAALPGYAPGWSPNSGLPQPDPTVGYTFDEAGSAPMTDGVAPMIYGSAPTNPLNGPYGPFQRWTWYGYYAYQSTGFIGKLFFTIPGLGDYVCTASVIGQSTIATAAHCLKSDLDGDGSAETWHTNWEFCPSWYKGSGSGDPFPSRGCWSWSTAVVSTHWASESASDRDYACIVLDPQNTWGTHGKVGNTTGWAGRAWNYSSSQPIFSWGYPSGPTWPGFGPGFPEGPRPFPGYHIIVASGPEWYEVNMTSGDGQVSKYMGNDMTGGSSGGPWWMSIRHWTAEYTDTDGFDTDPPGCGTLTSPCVPGGPFLNGVNSHKRCLVDCWMPISNAGIFFQEMGSPQFRGTAGDTDESEDVFAICYSSGG